MLKQVSSGVLLQVDRPWRLLSDYTDCLNELLLQYFNSLVCMVIALTNDNIFNMTNCHSIYAVAFLVKPAKVWDAPGKCMKMVKS